MRRKNEKLSNKRQYDDHDVNQDKHNDVRRGREKKTD